MFGFIKLLLRQAGLIRSDPKTEAMLTRNRKLAVIMNHFRDHEKERQQAKSLLIMAQAMAAGKSGPMPTGPGQAVVIPPDGGAVGKGTHAAAVQYTTGSHTVSKRTRRRRERGRTLWR